ncbi:dipeptidase [Microlunatus soli]|uniref:Acetylornithine deacetylase/Succinyl-diaminopimelate desuccinylase n=1 Tax=Microlunatus soli TaxID=630515 RepID=A0A1H1VRQ7_9ACTN|nr:dipeptidase [Microlunatus soli]SDS87638.1 Acetylornithine deacetylase/Succinyl-diaminopimelate desuccinylase [Microlunatus soli]
MTAVPTTAEDVRAAVERELPGVLATLKDHVAIPSVSADPGRDDQVRASADFVAAQLRSLGAAEVTISSVDGGKPAVIAHFPAPAGQPTVCLYAHHDVQPEGDRSLWDTGDPFVQTQVGERVFGRGVADDKGGLAMHLAALRAFGGKPPVGVTLFIEGEEEVGSPTLRALLDKHRDELASDVFVIGDSGNWEVGVPAFTNTLRGLAEAYVELRTIDHALHSGMFGGLVPDALTAICRLLATLHDEQGNVAVEGLHTAPTPDVDYPEDRVRRESAILDGVQLIGEGPYTERIWAKPSITVVGLDATPVDKASNTLWPVAKAKISMRLAPGQDAADAQQKLIKHLEDHVPWGAQLTVTGGETGNPSVVPFDGPYAEAARSAFTDAWGTEPVFMGQGGSIPMIADFAEAYPDATILVTGVCDPDSRPHGSNESLHLGDFGRAAVGEALLLLNCSAITA